MLVIPSVVVALAMLVPIVYLAIRSTEAGADVWPLIYRQRTGEIFWNTVKLAVGVTSAATAISVPYAWLVTQTDIPLRKFWAVLAPLPLVIPSYAGTIAVIGALGPRGLIQEWLEPVGIDRMPNIYGYWGAWGVLTLLTYPYIYLAVAAAFRGLDPTLEDASRMLHRDATVTFFRCTLSQLRPAIVAGGLLTTLYVVSDFGVVTLMRYDAFTRTIYTQYRSAFDRTFAAALGLLLVAFAVMVLSGEGLLRGRARYHRAGTGINRVRTTTALGTWKWLGFAFCLVVQLAALGVPILTLCYWLLTGSSAGHQLGDLPGAAGHSFLLALLAAGAAIAAGSPIAALSARHSRLPVSRILERMTYLGHALPGIVIALSFVFLGARYVPSLYQTLPWMVAAMVVKFLPQAVGAVRASLLQSSPRMEESSRMLGMSPVRTAARVTVPLAKNGIGAGFVLVFLTVMKELPITLLLSPTGFNTLATEIWSSTDAGSYGRAAAPALMLIVISAIPVAFFELRSNRSSGSASYDRDRAAPV
jgi:iron(III) transport system permease protein